MIILTGYMQGSSTLTTYGGRAYPGVEHRRVHDAGDYDIRLEYAGGDVYRLSRPTSSSEMTTTQPPSIKRRESSKCTFRTASGYPQQVEHAWLSIVGGYDHWEGSTRGMICHDLRQMCIWATLRQ